MVSTTWSLALVAGPLGLLAAGLLVEAAGPALTLTTMAAGLLLCALYAARTPGLHHLAPDRDAIVPESPQEWVMPATDHRSNSSGSTSTSSIPARGVVRLSAQRLAVWALGAAGDPVATWLGGSPRTDVYPLYERLRARGPVVRSRTGLHAVTSRSLCDQILRDAHFGVRHMDGTALYADPLMSGAASALGESFLDLDPPDHTRLRRAVAPAFRPARMRDWRPRIEATMHRLLDRADRRARRGDRLNLMRDIAAPFPIAVISELLGIPDVDTDQFTRIGTVVGQALDGVRSLRHARCLQAAGAELDELLTRLLDQRTVEPRDDVLSVIASARADGTASTSDATATAGLLLIAGFETTVNLVGNGLAALHADPGSWHELVADPSLAVNAVEETLRYDPPVQATMRAAHTPVNLLDTALQPGDTVLLLLAAANRDPGVYADPDRFDLHRTGEPDHLAFSSGIHYCLGAPLARMEGEIAFRVLAERWPRLRLTVGARRRTGSTIRGYTHLPAQLSGLPTSAA